MNKSTLTKLICFALILASVWTVSSFTVSGATTSTVDYSRPGSDLSKTINSAELLETLLGAGLSLVEREYLVEYGSVNVKYDDRIPSRSVVAGYDADTGVLNLTANKYTYTSESGIEVVWVPDKATLLNEEKQLVREGDAYKTTFTGVPSDDENLAVNVSYTLDIVIDQNTANALANQAYADAPVLKDAVAAKNAEYQQALAKYNADLAVYNKYLDDKAAFNNYLDLKWEYDDAWSKYNDYLSEKAAFDAYQAYLEALKPFNNYQSEIEAYNNAVNEYNAKYVEPVARCERAIAILDWIYEEIKSPKVSNARVLYNDIKSNLATSAVDNETVLVNALGVDPKIIENAADSTTILRELLDEYKEEYYDKNKSTKEKYNEFYLKNYTQLKDAFWKLFSSLYYLSTISIVCAGISGIVDGRDRMPQFRHFVFALYIVCEALDDSPVKDVNGKTLSFDNIYVNGESFKRTMSGVTYVKNTNNDSTPISTGYPAYREKPAAPVLPEGEYPTPVPKADEPTFLEEPTLVEPDEVTEPDIVTEPTPVEAPTFDPKITNLIAAYDRGELNNRSGAFSSDYVYTVHSSLNKRFINVTTIAVSFYGNDNDLIFSTEIDSGSYALFEGTKPYKAEDARAKYYFIGWQNSEGELVDTSSINEECNLYPCYREEVKSYVVTWDIDGIIDENYWTYGSVPAYTYTPIKIANGQRKYFFIGWDSNGDGEVDYPKDTPLPEVTATVSYVALFDMKMEIKTGDDTVTAIFDGKTFDFDATASQSKEFDLDNVFKERDPNDRDTKVIIRTNAANVEISHATLNVMEQLGITRIYFRSINRADGSMTFSITAKSPDGVAITDSDCSVKVYLNTGAVDPNRFRVVYTDEVGKHNVVKHNFESEASGLAQPLAAESSRISFLATPGHTYRIANFYWVHILAGGEDPYVISTLSTGYFAGETVSLGCTVNPGYSFDGFVVKDELGNEISLNASTFTMPELDVSVSVKTTRLTYQIVFKNGDLPHETLTLYYGETPTIPATAPSKAATEESIYRFIGWDYNMDGIADESIPPVTGDMIITALYEELDAPVEEEVDTEPVDEEDGLDVWVIILIVVGSVLGAGVVTFVVILIIRRR